MVSFIIVTIVKQQVGAYGEGGGGPCMSVCMLYVSLFCCISGCETQKLPNRVVLLRILAADDFSRTQLVAMSQTG